MGSKFKITLFTQLLFLTLIIVIFVIYILPIILYKEIEELSLIEKFEKDYSFVYSNDLPLTDVIVLDNVLIGISPDVDTYIPQQIIIPQGVTSIKDNAFENFYGLIGVTFCDTLENVGKNAFLNCVNLQYIDTNENLKTIDDYAFYNIELDKINLPSSLKYLGVSSLNLIHISTVQLQDNVQLGSNCLNFTDYYPYGQDEEVIVNNLYIRSPQNINGNYVIPEGITSVEDNAFYFRENLQSIEIPDGVLYIAPRAFMGCKNLIEVTFPDSLIAIDSYAFYNCTSLTNVKFNEGLKIIGYESFANCNLLNVELPSTIVEINDNSF